MAIGIDLGVSLVGSVGGFRVHAGHFAERFALIIIIALGESIVAIGVGASGLALGAERARLARDAYPYLHLPMVAGIIFVALGIKQTMAHVGDPLGTIPAVALCGGVALYLLGHNAFRLREESSVSVPRVVLTAVCCALIPVAASVPSLIILAILAVLLCTLAAFETMRSREFPAQ